MCQKNVNDWNPELDAVLKDQIVAYDHMRSACPVAFSERHQWSLFEHKDIEHVIHEHQSFSNVVSKYRSVPNGMDPPEHIDYRKIIEPYFSIKAMSDFEPACRKLAGILIDNLSIESPTEIISEFAQKFAVQVQCAFLGWPSEMQQVLHRWWHKNQDAVFHQDKTQLRTVANEFYTHIKNLLQARRDGAEISSEDVTTSLLNTQVNGHMLSDEDIVSILRNWTAGEIGTIAAAIGILIHFLATHPQLQKELRAHKDKLPEAIDEILRIHGPLITNRRVTTQPVCIGGREINKGERLTLFWVSANRDNKVFDDAQQFRWGRDQSKNLLYGAGIHVCPGAPLARLELRIVMEELLNRTRNFVLPDSPPPQKAIYPSGGFSKLMIRIT